MIDVNRLPLWAWAAPVAGPLALPLERFVGLLVEHRGRSAPMQVYGCSSISPGRQVLLNQGSSGP
jgi:hypothetical protein